MAPGPKKKGSNQRGGEERPSNRKRDHVQKQSGSCGSSEKNVPEKNDKDNLAGDKMQNETKAVIANNWDRYEEPVQDAHADISRGDDFEVLLSYSSGAGSQLQLQEEREWDEFKFDVKNLVLDMGRVSSMLKCIPFHKRLDIPESVFSCAQIQNFEQCAESNRNSYNISSSINISELLVKQDSSVGLRSVKQDLSTDSRPLKQDSKEFTPEGEYIVEKEEDAIVFHRDESSKVPFIHEKTENLIESLSSCLSAKASLQENDMKNGEEKIESPVTETDDLSYLLSLTSASNAADKPNSTDSKKLTKSNVDEWLSSILDE